MIGTQHSEWIEPLNHIRVTQALQGISVPIVVGTTRVTGLLVWTGDFKVTSHNPPGGKGFGAKGSVIYTYNASWISLLCQGPIQAIHNIWDQSGQYVAQQQQTNFTIPTATPPAQPKGPTPDPRWMGDMGVYGPNGPFQYVPYDYLGGAPVPTLSAGQYTHDGAGNYTFSNSDSGLNVTIYNTYFYNNRAAQELHVVPASSPYTFTADHGGTITDYTGFHDIFVGDWGARYYPSGTPLTKVSGSPAQGQYSVSISGGIGTYTFNSADASQEIVINYEWYDSNDDTYAPRTLGVTFFPGVLGQAAWSYLSGSHPDQAVSYSLSAYAAFQNAYLGMSGSPPVSSYEITGFDAVGGGILDASPIDAFTRFLTDPDVGVGYPSSSIDNATWKNNGDSAQNWVKANSFFISQAISNQETVASIVGRWLEAFQIAAFYSEGMLKLKPFGDQSVSSSLATYTPNTTPIVSLTDNDFLSPSSKAEDPVKIAQTPYADRYNRTQVEYLNRYNAYNTDIVYEQDEASVERFGLRPEPPLSYDFITTAPTAAAVASLRLKRNIAVRDKYTFKLPLRYAYLEPMDLIQITDSRLGLESLTVRITQIDNDPKTGLSVTCEDFPAAGYGMPVSNPKALTPPLHPPHGTAGPGETNFTILQYTSYDTGKESTKLYIYCTGEDVNWGGCTVWVSLDGSNYSPIATVTQPARIGRLLAALPSVTANPTGNYGTTTDTTNTVDVQLQAGNQDASQAGVSPWSPTTAYVKTNLVTFDGALWACVQANTNSVPTLSNVNWQLISQTVPLEAAFQTVSASVAQNLGTLSAVINTSTGAVEFLSYTNVAAGALPNEYQLTDLYRGAYGTTIGSFPVGSEFVRIKDASAVYSVPPGMGGQTIYIRFTAVNALGGAGQSVDTAETATITVATSGGASAIGWGWQNLDSVPDGNAFKKVMAVNSSNQATTASLAPNAITSSISQTTTSYVNITTSGQIASATITPSGGYVTLKVCGAIASTNSSASGWGLTFYKNGTAMSPAFSYQSFATPGDDKYRPFCFIIPDTSPGTSQVTYSVSVSTNSGGTVSLIPVEFIVENMKV